MRSSEAIDALAAWLRRTKGESDWGPQQSGARSGMQRLVDSRCPAHCPKHSEPLAAAEARISFNEADPIAALDALLGTSVVAIEFSDCVVIPASTLSHHPSLTRLCFDHSEVTPLRDLAGFTQLHGLRELVCIFQGPNPPRHQLQLQHALPLSQLEVLDIDGMQIVGADAGLAALTRLRELRLSNSDLRTVPASMASLTRLTRLSLDAAAQGAGGWRHLPLQLEYLKIIGLYGGLTAMPPELSRLTRLSQLDVSWNDLGDAGPDVALPTNLAATLQLLDISFNSLTEVPAALAPMTGLRQLNLSGNYHIAGSWQHLTGMKQLERLRLTDCDLAAVPEVLSQLTALTSVDLSRILIASDWQHPSSS